MNRLIAAIPMTIALAVLALPGSLSAEPPAAQAAGSPADWSRRLADAHSELLEAREAESETQTAYVRARHKNHPRGQALADLRTAMEDAKTERAELEESFPELVDQARRAGVPFRVLAPYEED